MSTRAERRKEYPHVCPSCGSDRVSGLRRKVGTAQDGYKGWWLECDDCMFQGPLDCWQRMTSLRNRYGLPKERWMQLVARCASLLEQETPGVKRQSSMKGENTIEYRSAIEDFGKKMLAELESNDRAKGNFLAWKPTAEQGFSELEHHVIKLAAALDRKNPLAVTEHCADIVNICMAIDRTLGSI